MTFAKIVDELALKFLCIGKLADKQIKELHVMFFDIFLATKNSEIIKSPGYLQFFRMKEKVKSDIKKIDLNNQDFSAMTINLKKDIEEYIKRKDFLAESDNQLERILYEDDIDTNKYINYNKKDIVTHIGYKIYYKNQIRLQLNHYRTYSVIQSKKVKKNYAVI
uniref:Cilia- and flagella-associated protein 299 n=1 Tax=Strongyloides venezuelensis TaxID=75913 RepID=A0A0K0FPN6_STRVS